MIIFSHQRKIPQNFKETNRRQERVSKMNREGEFGGWEAEVILNHIITNCSLNLVQKRQNVCLLYGCRFHGRIA